MTLYLILLYIYTQSWEKKPKNKDVSGLFAYSSVFPSLSTAEMIDQISDGALSSGLSEMEDANRRRKVGWTTLNTGPVWQTGCNSLTRTRMQLHSHIGADEAYEPKYQD